MRYLLTLVLLSLTPLPAGAVSSVQPASCQAGQQIAQNRCYQVAAWFPPSMMNCEQVGTTQLGVPIWLCC